MPRPRASRPASTVRAHVAALGADAGDEDRHVAHDRPHGRELGRIGGADHDGAVAVPVPVLGDAPRHGAVERLAADLTGPGTRRRRGWRCGRGRSCPRSARSRKGRERLAAEIGVDRDGVGAEPVEGVVDVALVGRADVAALGVVDDRHGGRRGPDVAHHGASAATPARPEALEEGGVGLERAGEVGRGVDDRGAEPRTAAPWRRRTGRPRRRRAGRPAAGPSRGRARPRRRGPRPSARRAARGSPRAAVRGRHARTRHFSVSPAHMGTTLSPMPGASTSAGTSQGSSTSVSVSALRS